jgi:hypothetical protein
MGKEIERARAAKEDLVKLWLSEERVSGEKVDVRSEFFFSPIEISESALQSV